MFVQNMKDKKCKTYEQVCLLYVDQFIVVVNCSQSIIHLFMTWLFACLQS